MVQDLLSVFSAMDIVELEHEEDEEGDSGLLEVESLIKLLASDRRFCKAIFLPAALFLIESISVSVFVRHGNYDAAGHVAS
jgi:hypothetical protein